ncbi:subclass B3 metallo-beta-lactamase [Sphingobium sp. Sx8-8]|uniref:subclass B3 metallo-beta-lactamase n=1 Tax=Sphingobium sp. Sx8-8 TaxID=2933617 RepID=UPI001F59A058|nr:subclass B3 metallo-beta-lactamase [Sphingobium sp. Sx8-8]
MRRALCLSISLAAALLSPSGAAHGANDPLLRPIEPDYARQWLDPERPHRIFGNSYSVGFGGLSVALIRTDAGLILIDGALPQAVRDIEANIRALGFSIRDVKLILSTEPHYDHAGGLAALARDSGAPVVASAYAAQVLRKAGKDANDPQASIFVRIPAVTKLRIARSGEAVRLGGVTITPVATPGHTMGSMSWRWRSCEGRDCRDMVFASSLNAVSGDGYRFSDPAHRSQVAALRKSFAIMRALPCDMLITAHPDQGKGANCRSYADSAQARLDARLRKEASARPWNALR